LPNSNVSLVGTVLGAASGKDGGFTISNVPAGTYQIKVSYIGYEPVKQTIIISDNEKLSLNFALREDLFQTEQIVVTATRTPKLMQDVPVVTELVTREEIEEKGAEDLSEILEDRPGIAVETGTTGGKFIYMNGVDSRRILFLVDGVPISGKLNNRIQLNLIDSDKIKQVEIVRGPGSALYGNDAMGGVIHIITKDFTTGLKIKANGRMGSNDLYSGSLSLSGGAGALGYYVNVDHFREGYDQGASEIEIKDSKANSVLTKVKYQNAGIGRVEVGAEYRQDEQTSESSFMGGTYDNVSQVKYKTGNVKWKRRIGSALGMNVIGYYNDNFRTFQSGRQGSSRPAKIDTTTDNMIGLKSDFELSLSDKVTFDVGFDYSNNNYDNPRLGKEKTRTQTGFFAQMETRLIHNLTLILGGRYDKITDIYAHISPRVSAMYSLTTDLKFRASWGQGFRAPSFIELYSDFPIPIPGMPMRVLGNKDLTPEKSTGSSFGLEYFWNTFMLINATYFENKFEDMIVDFQPAPLTFSYLNVENATFRGVEFQSRVYLLDNLTTTIGYNYTNIAQADEDAAFSRISPHTASIRVNHGLFKNKVKISLREQYFSEREILVVSHHGDFSKVNKNAYHVVDLTVSYKLSERLAVRLGSVNITDYTDKDYGPWVGRRVFFGLYTGI